jgi:hypothetical protein
LYLRACDWAPNGKYIVVADVKGIIHLLDPETLNIRNSLQSVFKPDPKKRGDPWIEVELYFLILFAKIIF